MNPTPSKRHTFIIAFLIAGLVLSMAVTYAQVNYLGMHFLRVQQEKVHVQMLQGDAGNPWQYRILADVAIDPLIQLCKKLGIPQPESFSFIAFRFVQCLFILLAAGFYYRKLGLTVYENLIGLSVLSWSLSYSLYNSDLSLNVFFDIAFYLLAALFILEKRYVWLVLLMIPAALNRETSVLIPFMLYFTVRSKPTEKNISSSAIVAAIAGLAIYLAIFAGLRVYYGNQQFLTADGYYPGLGLLFLNLQRPATWEQFAITLGIIPLLAVFALRMWPRNLRRFFWVIVPIWFAVHFVSALVAETRLLLVPQALIFIPGALFGLSETHAERADADRDRPAEIPG
jgi:hypothetical protein